MKDLFKDINATLILVFVGVGFLYFIIGIATPSDHTGLMDLFQHSFATLIGFFFGRHTNNGNGGRR